MEEEIWKDIPGHDGFQASTLGRIRSLDRYKTYSNGRVYFYKGRILQGSLQDNGYIRYNIEGKQYLGHFLVLDTFDHREPRPECINHKNEIKSDNRLSNLEWATYQYNNTYGTAIERTKRTRREKHIGWKAIVQFTLDDVPIKIWESTLQASQYGYIRESISKCMNGTGGRKTACGFKWKFLSDVDLTDEQKAMLAAASPVKPIDGVISRRKKIVQLAEDGKLVKVWDSIKEAERCGFQHSNIILCLQHKQEIHKGFRWVLFDEYKF
mgnify:CR=1 FL=1